MTTRELRRAEKEQPNGGKSVIRKVATDDRPDEGPLENLVRSLVESGGCCAWKPDDTICGAEPTHVIIGTWQVKGDLFRAAPMNSFDMNESPWVALVCADHETDDQRQEDKSTRVTDWEVYQREKMLAAGWTDDPTWDLVPIEEFR